MFLFSLHNQYSCYNIWNLKSKVKHKVIINNYYCTKVKHKVIVAKHIIT